MTTWYEYRLPKHMRGDQVRRELLRFAGHFRRAHCFNDEPWHPGGWVARVTFVPDHQPRSMWDMPAPRREWALAESMVPFDADADVLGHHGLSALDQVLRYAPDADRARLGKLIHCVLNQAGYTRLGEVAFGLDMAWRAAVMAVIEDRPRVLARLLPLLRRIPGPRGTA